MIAAQVQSAAMSHAKGSAKLLSDKSVITMGAGSLHELLAEAFVAGAKWATEERLMHLPPPPTRGEL